LNYVDGFGEATMAQLIKARQAKAFTGLTDFCRRTRLPRRLVEHLILAGAMDRWQLPRRQLLWELGQLRYREEELDLIFPVNGVELPSLSRAEALSQEHSVVIVISLGFNSLPSPPCERARRWWCSNCEWSYFDR
jgi:hypothetical protein